MNSGVTSADGMGYMTDERILIRDSARDFTMKEVLPVANELDPVQGMIPMELRDKMAEMGYFGITTPEELGGMGLGCFEYCLIAEQLARGWMSVASIIARGNGSFLRRGIMRGKEDELPEEQRDMIRRAVKGEFSADRAAIGDLDFLITFSVG